MRNFSRIFFFCAIAFGVGCLLTLIVNLHHHEQPIVLQYLTSDPAVNITKNERTPTEYHEFMLKAVQDQKSKLYRFDRPGVLLPLMRVQEYEKDANLRTRVARMWLRSRSLVVAATARNAMRGLRSSLRNLQRLRSLFNESWVLFVENDSTDSTRRHLKSLAAADPNVVLLGCPATVDNCKLKIQYSSNKTHVPGAFMKRTFTEEVERGLMMSALRNVYLSYAYKHLPKADLMLMIDPDLTWHDWDMNSVLQGLYYFSAKPQLQQLCAHTTAQNHIYDPCTLAFFINKHFGEDTKLPVVDYRSALGSADKNRPPVKVSSCFQAFSFYRLSALATRKLWYTRADGEWMCEHNTLSRQLDEVYIDPQMKLQVKST